MLEVEEEETLRSSGGRDSENKCKNTAKVRKSAESPGRMSRNHQVGD